MALSVRQRRIVGIHAGEFSAEENDLRLLHHAALSRLLTEEQRRDRNHNDQQGASENMP
jgi:hypothetical protein